MSVLAIKGKVTGDAEVVRMLNRAPGLFLRYLVGGLYDERARFLGGKGSKGARRRGYRDILDSKRRWKRSGTWASQVTGMFKGYIPKARRLDDLMFKAGVGLNNPRKMHRAMWFLQTGGGHTSAKEMPIPVYRNLARQGVSRGFWKAKAFKRMISQGQLVRLPVGGMAYYFLKGNRYKKGQKAGQFRRNALMFVGVKSMTASRQFTGRYDFYGRWERMVPQMIGRLQKVVDRAASAAQRGKTY